MWNYHFSGYPGTVNTLKANLIPFEAQLAQTTTAYVHRPSTVTFEVQGEMRSETGSLEGIARRKYMFYLNSLRTPNVLPSRLLQQGLKFYSVEELWNRRAVRMSTALSNRGEVGQILQTAQNRQHTSWHSAHEAEKAKTFPFHAGLPELGKR